MTWRAIEEARRALDEDGAAGRLRGELETAQQQAPTMFAAYRTLGLIAIGELDRALCARGLTDSLLPYLSATAVASVVDLDLGIDRRVLCEKVNQYYAWVAIEKLKAGALEEPQHVDCGNLDDA